MAWLYRLKVRTSASVPTLQAAERSMTNWLSTSSQDIAVLSEINRGASDRALGIIAASLVEIHLTKLIEQAFIAETRSGSRGTVRERMFQSSGPLGTFSTKIRLAYLMGMIGEELFKNLDIMKEIRNRFAHRTEIGSFDHPEISSRCFNFTLVDKYVIDPANNLHGDPSAHFALENPGAANNLKIPKERYSLTAQVFSIGIQHATVNARPYTPNF
jgi:DNA-binding MltR family transcriptional regulator